MPGITVFSLAEARFEPYIGDPATPEQGGARIARLIGRHNSQTLGGGVVVYERLTVDWTLPFDEMITVIAGSMKVQSGGSDWTLVPGDVAWFPAGTPLTYIVDATITVSYAIYPQA